MRLKPSGDYADYYPNVIGRLPHWRASMPVAPRIHLTRDWVRDLPATRLRPDPGKPPGKLLAPIGHLFVHNRYTRLGAFPSIYFSDGVTTASSEVFGESGVHGVPKDSRLQLVVRANLPVALDLTDAHTLSFLGLTPSDVAQKKDPLDVDIMGRPRVYELPQCLGELANELGILAIQFTSAPASPGINVVIFTDHLATTGGWYDPTDPVTGLVERCP
ncbi:MAG: hypothetical protein ACT4P7_15585 [Gemmatimonadaceae bacterium]